MHAHRRLEDVDIPELKCRLEAADAHINSVMWGCMIGFAAVGFAGWRVYDMRAGAAYVGLMIFVAILALYCAWFQISLAYTRWNEVQLQLKQSQERSQALYREYETALRRSQPGRRELTLTNATRFGFQRLITHLWGSAP